MKKPASIVFVTGVTEKTRASLAAIRPDGSISTLRPMILWALEVLRWVAGEVGQDALEITSGPDGKHSWPSLHYAGCAVDIRSRGMTRDQVEEFVSRAREELGPDFDVIDEDTHIHIEWQPKGPGVDVRPRHRSDWQ